MSKSIYVKSIPSGLTDQGLEDELTAPYDDGFYLLCLLDSGRDTLRAVFKRAANYVDPAHHADEESRARAIVTAHPELSLPRMVGLLASRGIKRNAGWVSAERSRMSFSAAKRTP